MWTANYPEACGINILYNFNKHEALESDLLAFDQLLKDYPYTVTLVSINERQKPVWHKHLIDRKFKIIETFINKNTGNICYIYSRNTNPIK